MNLEQINFSTSTNAKIRESADTKYLDDKMHREGLMGGMSLMFLFKTKVQTLMINY